MQFFAYLLFLLSAVLSATAVDVQKSFLVSFDKDVPDSTVAQASTSSLSFGNTKKQPSYLFILDNLTDINLPLNRGEDHRRQGHHYPRVHAYQGLRRDGWREGLREHAGVD